MCLVLLVHTFHIRSWTFGSIKCLVYVCVCLFLCLCGSPLLLLTSSQGGLSLVLCVCSLVLLMSCLCCLVLSCLCVLSISDLERYQCHVYVCVCLCGWFSIASINFFSKRPLASESASADFLPTTAHCFNSSSHPRSRQRLVSNQNAKAKDIKYPSSHPRNRHHSKAATAQNRSQEYPFSPFVYVVCSVQNCR